MAERTLAFNGIDAATGKPLPSPGSLEEFADWVPRTPLSPRSEREFGWLLEEYGKEDPLRGTIYKDEFHQVDIHDLASAGYAVVLSPRLAKNQDVVEKLKPLLDLRKAQAKSLFKLLVYKEGQSTFDFLDDLKVEPGPADPRKLPYYILLVGGPEEIPFDFQYELDVMYAVGRICFDTLKEYEQYAKSVEAAEGGDRPPRRVTLFGASMDDVTERTARDLTLELGKALEAHGDGWSVRSWAGAEADKPLLERLLGGERSPAIVVASGHGLVFPPGDPNQRSMQGSILCAGGSAGKDVYLAAKDLEGGGGLTGSMVCLFACYSAGTPEFSSFPESSLGLPRRVAPAPFVSALAQKSLVRPGGGALAFLGHIDRMWTMAFSWSDRSQIQAYVSTFRQAMDGFRIGAATEFINARYVTFAVQNSQLSQSSQKRKNVDRDRLVRMLQAENDARNFVLFGDPAVRLT